MDKAIAYVIGCGLLLVVAGWLIRMGCEVFQEALKAKSNNWLMTIFWGAQGLSLAAFIIAVVFGIEGLWQASGLTTLALFISSWFVKKPY